MSTARSPFLAVVFSLLFISSSMARGAEPGPKPPARAAEPSAAQPGQFAQAPAGSYRLTAWSELGMHCIDGKDYSIFSVLPPYNVIHAQLIQVGVKPVPITSGVTITYQAAADAGGSINTISSTKTNFWTYAFPLFQAHLPSDEGLTGLLVQSQTPRPLTYNAALGYWEAVGIPTVPYDDNNAFKPYPMALIIARDVNGNMLAQAKIVLSVSDEISCNRCHASNSDPDAKPPSGWANYPDPAKDPKLNILKIHDDKFNISAYLPLLAQKGYRYQASLYQTALGGTPILCAVCHASNALGTAGFQGIKPETAAVHASHGPVKNYQTGLSLDNSISNLGSCYLCHPGPTTQCLRGAMSSNVKCTDCHGSVSMVGNQTRIGWITLPACQMCHENSLRYMRTFDSPGHWRVATDLTFATNPDVPMPGADLYRYSRGHGQQYCSSCHGSPHAEFPTTQPNDNVYSNQLQGHRGTLRECNVCHNPIPMTLDQGPHGIHTIGQSWVNLHHDLIQSTQPCTYCHGDTYYGSFLSALKIQKTFNAGDYGVKTFAAGHQISCYDCHNGPDAYLLPPITLPKIYALHRSPSHWPQPVLVREVVGQNWVDQHQKLVKDVQVCMSCHGPDLRGTSRSGLKATKTFHAGEHGNRTFAGGHMMNCFDCHDGAKLPTGSTIAKLGVLPGTSAVSFEGRRTGN